MRGVKDARTDDDVQCPAPAAAGPDSGGRSGRGSRLKPRIQVFGRRELEMPGRGRLSVEGEVPVRPRGPARPATGRTHTTEILIVFLLAPGTRPETLRDNPKADSRPRKFSRFSSVRNNSNTTTNLIK